MKFFYNAGVKNLMEDHDFEYVSGYDAELDGDDPTWGRCAVRCRKCNEERRIGISVEAVNSMGGCVRKGDLKPRRQDFVAIGGVVEYFKELLPNGKVLTLSAGNAGYHENPPEQVRLITMYGQKPLDV